MTPLDIHIRDEIDLDLEQELGRKYAVRFADEIGLLTEDGFSICAEVLDYTYIIQVGYDICTEGGFSLMTEDGQTLVTEQTYDETVYVSKPAGNIVLEQTDYHTERYSYLKEDIPLPVGTTIEITDWI